MTLDLQIAGLLTLVFTAVGAGAACVGCWLFRHSKSSTGRKMRHYLVAHGALFLVTMAFGIAGMVRPPEWVWDVIYYTRVPVLCLESFYLVTLVIEFYNIENKPSI